MEPIKIFDNLFWVGAIDYEIRDFHGFRTSDGTTYNAYLMLDEKITLIDTVKAPFVPEMLSRISKIVDPKKIDQVVSNHAELDHSSGLPQTVSSIGADKPVYASKIGEKTLKGQMRECRDLHFKPVSSGDTVSLGKLGLQFQETRMLHWPDSMFCFCPEMGVLFSQDMFGIHMAGSRLFDDEVGRNVWGYQALKYFANVLTPYMPIFEKMMDGITASGLLGQVKMICPDHGFIWRSNPGEIIDLSRRWAKQTPSRRAVVVYDTMWQSTEKIAMELGGALSANGVLVRLMSMKNNHPSDILTEIFSSGAVLVGSPTVYNGIYSTIVMLLNSMRGMNFQNKVGAAFGSHGWSGEAPKMLQTQLADMKYSMVCPELRVQWAPDESNLASVQEMAREVAEALPKEPVGPDFGI